MAHGRLPMRRADRTTTTTTASATSVSTHVMPVANENAAPGLRISRSCSRSPSSGTVRPDESRSTASALVTWSRA